LIKHNKLTILDLSKDEDINLSNTIIYQISYGTTKISNCKILKKNFFSEVKFKKYKNKINNSLVNFYKFLSKKKIHNDLIPLEILNQRNDKTQIFNKIFYLLEIKDYIAKNKINNVEIITDDENFFNAYKSLKIKNLSILNLSKKKKNNINLIYFSKTLIFYLKTFLFVCFIKLFLRKKKIEKRFSEGCLTLYPLFFKKKKNLFYSKKLLNLNFQITDETHLSNTLLKNLNLAMKVDKIENTILVEKYIGIGWIIKSFFMSLKNIKLMHESEKFKFEIDGINFSFLFRNLFLISLLNLNKLSIYEGALSKILTVFKLKKFHYFLFEYNFGYYLSNIIKKISPGTKQIGYQHGIYSERLMWQNFSKKIKLAGYFPNEIICKFKYSLDSYKKNFKNIKIILKKSNKILTDNFIEKKDKKYIVYLGLHDCYNILNELRNLKNNQKFILNLHPKIKYKNILKLNKNFVINDKKTNINAQGKVLLSTTSTMPYQFYPKKKFNIILPKNIIPLNPRLFDKFFLK